MVFLPGVDKKQARIMDDDENGPRITYISWAPHCSRSDHTARELGGTSHMVYWESLGSRPATVWLKYLGQALRTWAILLRERPSAAFVMSPSPVAVLAVWAYCLPSRTPFVIDAHTGAFHNPMWKRLQRLQFWLCRHAAATIVTNEYLASLVNHHGGHAVIVPDVPIHFPESTAQRERDVFTVACVTSFGRDEPVEAVVEAARLLPDVQFHMTGNAARHVHRLGNLPANVSLTGFLDVDAYGTLLKTAHVVMALTTEDHTMLRGAYEAIYQGTPVIVSDTVLLRSAFDEGAIHVDNTPAAIAEAVRSMEHGLEGFRRGAARLRSRKMTRWLESRSALIAAVSSPLRSRALKA